MKQLDLYDLLFGEAQSLVVENQAKLEKQSNLSSNITASNNSESESEQALRVTPIFTQWHNIKNTYPDALLLFRVGEFYEAYYQDAKDVCNITGITLTHHAKAGFEMCGFPFHALDNYLPRLVRAGRRVAICDQLEEPRLRKKLVKEVVQQPK